MIANSRFQIPTSERRGVTRYFEVSYHSTFLFFPSQQDRTQNWFRLLQAGLWRT